MLRRPFFLFLLPMSVLAGICSVDFRDREAALDDWNLGTTEYNSDRGRRFLANESTIDSPVFSGAVTSVVFSMSFTTSVGGGPSFTLFGGTDREHLQPLGDFTAGSHNTHYTNSVAIAAADDVRVFRLQYSQNASAYTNNAYVVSFEARWAGGPLQAPTKVKATEPTADSFRLSWLGDAPSYQVKVWTNAVTEAVAGNDFWCESFTRASASTSTQQMPFDTFRLAVDHFGEDWQIDHLYPSTEAGTVRIGATKSGTAGWLRTPPLEAHQACALRVRARVFSGSDDGHDMPVKLCSGAATNLLGVISLTGDFADYHLPVPAIVVGDRLEFCSTTNKASCRVVLDEIALVDGYVPAGESAVFVAEVATTDCECLLEGMPTAKLCYRVDAVDGVLVERSSEGQLNLADYLPATPPRALDISRAMLKANHGECVIADDFRRLAAQFILSGNSLAWTNGETLPPWQVFEDGVAPLTVTRNQGAVSSVGTYLYWDGVDADTASLGINVGSEKRESVMGFVLHNVTGEAIANLSLAYVARQFGFKNTVVQQLNCEWLVTNQLVSICAEGGWRAEEDLRYFTPVVGNPDGLEAGSTNVLAAVPSPPALSVPLAGAKVRDGEYLLVRWRRERVTNTAAIGIDEIVLRGSAEKRPTLVIIR